MHVGATGRVGSGLPGPPIKIQEHAMMDLIVLGLTALFFVATIAYAYACERL